MRQALRLIREVPAARSSVGSLFLTLQTNENPTVQALPGFRSIREQVR